MTVAGRTITKADFQSRHAHRSPIQNNRSDPPNGGLRSGATVDSQLLLQREVLQDQRAVSARENEQQPNNVDESGDHRFSITGSAHMAEGGVESGAIGFGEPQVPYKDAVAALTFIPTSDIPKRTLSSWGDLSSGQPKDPRR